MNRKTVIAAALMSFALPFAAMAQAPGADSQTAPSKVEAPAKTEAPAKMEKSAKKSKKGVKKAAPRRSTSQSVRPSESGTK